MTVGRGVSGAGDVRDFSSMRNRYLQKVRSRPPGCANLFDTPAPDTPRPTVIVQSVGWARHAGGWMRWCVGYWYW